MLSIHFDLKAPVLSMQFDGDALVLLAVMVVFSLLGYLALWRYVDKHTEKAGNAYQMSRSIKPKALRSVASILALITWPIWSFVQLLAAAIVTMVAIMYALLVYPVVRLVGRLQKP